MSSTDDIKKRVNELYEIIKSSQEELQEIRDNCDHSETEMGNYAWAPGHFQYGEICTICGEFVRAIVSDEEGMAESDELAFREKVLNYLEKNDRAQTIIMIKKEQGYISSEEAKHILDEILRKKEED